jgi:kynureninase
MAQIVGAKVDEIAIMGSLTANLHLLMAAFYTPTAERHKIIIEDKAFPSDHVSLLETVLILVCYGVTNKVAWIRSIYVVGSDIA